MKASDRYIKLVEWSHEDQCYVGTCPGLMLGGVHGENEAEVYKELCVVVDEWIKIHAADGDPLPEPTTGKEYSGKFVVRVGKNLHRVLALNALRSGESLNSHCVDLLGEDLTSYGNE
ncbi:MAG: toxin-antitoxin system HicB family antitoxin [Candidatus Sabulitectum sp.]|nr:toxin-antitoxin system HicB family antitoxin [Candidatus Sabulitectum sp.]